MLSGGDRRSIADSSRVRLLIEDNPSLVIEVAALTADEDWLVTQRALDPLQLALHGGEDFELLFTVKPGDVARLPKRVDGVEIKRIGEITEVSQGVKISEGARVWELNPGGWVHF